MALWIIPGVIVLLVIWIIGMYDLPLYKLRYLRKFGIAF
jgi:hypothetical protein